MRQAVLRKNKQFIAKFIRERGSGSCQDTLCDSSEVHATLKRTAQQTHSVVHEGVRVLHADVVVTLVQRLLHFICLLHYFLLVFVCLVKSVFLRSANTGSGGGGCVSEDVALL